MKGIEYDPSQTSLSAVLKDWQIKSMKVVWGRPEGANSRTVWMETNKALTPETISRASVINFLNDMKEMGVLDADERTGKGGHHLVYKMGMNEQQFKSYVADTLIGKLVQEFPEETRALLKQIR